MSTLLVQVPNLWPRHAEVVSENAPVSKPIGRSSPYRSPKWYRLFLLVQKRTLNLNTNKPIVSIEAPETGGRIAHKGGRVEWYGSEYTDKGVGKKKKTCISIL